MHNLIILVLMLATFLILMKEQYYIVIFGESLARFRGRPSSSSPGPESDDNESSSGSKSADFIRSKVILDVVCVERIRNGSRTKIKGTGGCWSLCGCCARTFSSSSRYISAKWYARLVGTFVSERLKGFM